MKKHFYKDLIHVKQFIQVIAFSFLIGIIFSVFPNQKVIIAVIDGSRYSETFGAGDT